MKVDIKLSEDIHKPYAVIYAREITKEIERASALLGADNSVIIGTSESKTVLLQPEMIYEVIVENKSTVIYCKDKKYLSRKRLYEIKQQLGMDFMQISKSSIINLKKVDSVEASLGGMMQINLTNGLKDYISIKYLSDFKKYLGI